MGLFNRSPEEKLAKAREHQAAGRLYDALKAYEDVIGSRAATADRMSAETGAMECRRAMIRQRLAEAEALCQAGDLESARDRCRTAMDLAGDDPIAAEIEEQLRRIDAPRLPVAKTGSSARLKDLLPEPDEVVAPEPTFMDRDRQTQQPEVGDEEPFEQDEDEMFEIHMNTVNPGTADFFRSLGPQYRSAFLALTHGDGKRALELLEQLDPGLRADPRVELDRANALLMTGDAEAAAGLLEKLNPGTWMTGAPEGEERESSGEDAEAAENRVVFDEGRRRILLIDALRSLHRHEDAVSEARSLADGTGGAWATAEALLAWALLEAGRPEEAYDRLQVNLARWAGNDEILIPAAQAAVALERREEAMALLEEMMRMRVQRSIAHGEELDFPVEAGRRLLSLYVETDHDPTEVRGLVLRLLDYDGERGEQYREMLMRLDRKR